MACLCCGGCVVAPVVILAVASDNAAAVIAAVVLLVSGFLFCLWGMWPALLPPPETPPEAYPLIHPTTVKKPKKVYVLVNPMGGTQGGVGIYDKMLPIFQAHGIKVDKRETEYAGHANALCNTLPLAGYDAIVAIGGDGTFHECVNGLMDRPASERGEIAMGLIPGEVSCCFAYLATLTALHPGGWAHRVVQDVPVVEVLAKYSHRVTSLLQVRCKVPIGIER